MVEGHTLQADHDHGTPSNVGVLTECQLDILVLQSTQNNYNCEKLAL